MATSKLDKQWPKFWWFGDIHIPKEEIDQNAKTGMPPPSPASFLSSELHENCTSGLLLVPLT